MSGNDFLNKNVLRWRWNVDQDVAEVTSSASWFHVWGPRKTNQNLVHYLSCQALRCTAFLLWPYGLKVNLASGPMILTLASKVWGLRFVVKAPKSTHITPILESLHWLKVNKRIEYKLLSLTYKVLTTSQPNSLHNLNSLQPPRSTRSSSVVIPFLAHQHRSLHHVVFGINFHIHSSA